MERTSSRALRNRKNKNQKNGAHLSIESYHKLNRAKNVSFWMHLHLREQDANAAPLMWMPDIFSYVHDDISAVLEEVKALGICDKFIKREH